MKWWASLLDLFFPPRCLFCGQHLIEEDDEIICRRCLASSLDPRKCCPVCSYPLQGDFCIKCRDSVFSFRGSCAVFLYQGHLKRVIRNYKYKRQKYIAGVLGKLVAQQVRRCSWPELDTVVPVPLHPQRLVDRGFDQALLLAQVVADELALPVRKVLVRDIDTPSQTRLNAIERRQNVKNAFSVRPGYLLTGKILLIDDLLTTGATGNSAGKALLSAGAEEVYLAVVGR